MIKVGDLGILACFVHCALCVVCVVYMVRSGIPRFRDSAILGVLSVIDVWLFFSQNSTFLRSYISTLIIRVSFKV